MLKCFLFEILGVLENLQALCMQETHSYVLYTESLFINGIAATRYRSQAD